MGLRELSIPGLFLVERPPNRDERGFFREVVRWDELEEATGSAFHPVQWNHSVSEPGVLRALHAENWNKLIYPVTGRMFAAVGVPVERLVRVRIGTLRLGALAPGAVRPLSRAERERLTPARSPR